VARVNHSKKMTKQQAGQFTSSHAIQPVLAAAAAAADKAAGTIN